jgi:cell wall-associated NlpC family hydrolase
MSSIFTASAAIVPDVVVEDVVLTNQNDQSILDNEGWLSGQELIDHMDHLEDLAKTKIDKMNARGKQQMHEEQLADNARAIESMMNAVEQYIGKTPYVFSGSTPRGWDCSGLTSWAYARLGIELPHSASAQLYSGDIVSKPKPGDLVIFGSGYHAALYAKPGVMLHSGGHPGERTEYRKISDFPGAVRYVRLLDTP